MDRFRILNSRKRAIIALVHSIAFGFLAGYQLAIHHHPSSLMTAAAGNITGPAVLTIIYLTVTSVLLLLTVVSRSAIERLYFCLCTASAGVGLLRVLFGDPTSYAGNLARVVLLACAVLTGAFIVRSHANLQPEFSS